MWSSSSNSNSSVKDVRIAIGAFLLGIIVTSILMTCFYSYRPSVLEATSTITTDRSDTSHTTEFRMLTSTNAVPNACKAITHALYHPHSHVRGNELRSEWEHIAHLFMWNTQSKYATASDSEIEYPYSHQRFDMLGPVVDACKTPIESFGEGDSEKRVCGLSLIETMVSNCVVFSIGSNNQWGFEEAVHARTNCRIETFDCTIGEESMPPAAIRDRTRLHFVCLGKYSEIVGGRKFVNWEALLALSGIKEPPTFLKMDIEGYEFPVIESIIEAGVLLPLQIAMEVHYFTYEHIFKGRKSSAELYAFMNYMHKFGGYHLIDRNDNIYCSHCSEIILARLNCYHTKIAIDHHHNPGRAKYPALMAQRPSSLKTRIDELIQSGAL